MFDFAAKLVKKRESNSDYCPENYKIVQRIHDIGFFLVLLHQQAMNTMKRLTRFLTLTVLYCLSLSALAQDEKSADDSLLTQKDSLIEALLAQVQDLQLQGLMMKEQIERTDNAVRNDSLRKALRKTRIDSLRQVTPGVPLIIKSDTLFTLYNRKGGLNLEDRVNDIREKILEVGMSIKLFADSIYIFEGEYTTDIMAGNDVLMSVSDMDGLWQNTSRQKLAADYRTIIEAKVNELHAEYGLRQKLVGIAYAAGIILMLGLLIWVTNWCYRRWRVRLLRKILRRTRMLAIKDYEVLDLHRQGIVFLTALNVLRYLIIIILLFICIPLLFAVFPETKSFTTTIFGYIWNPFVGIIHSIIGFLPRFFKIIVIILCFRYLVKGIRYLTNEISSGKLKINGFYADWAKPTYFILRLLCYSFMLVMIWPLLPNSNSEVFQGVSVFIGIIISLGSSSIIGNVMAGMVMTYMRPFHVGDFIKYGDTQGFVIEKTMLVTRIRTLKNEVITIPNSNLMTSQTSNFTFAARNYGVIVHTKVTIGYDMQWQLIRDLLLDAAYNTPHLSKKPEPFVRITTLDDFYVEYEINAYTRKSDSLPEIYSTLHQNILDSFHTHGVEIMSPHIFAHRNELELQIPKKQQ